jgi:hypothetical protein
MTIAVRFSAVFQRFSAFFESHPRFIRKDKSHVLVLV